MITRKDEIEQQLKDRNYRLDEILPENKYLRSKNFVWKVSSLKIDWDWNFKDLVEIQAFLVNEKEIFRHVCRRLSK
jgi:hypothetical protein